MLKCNQAIDEAGFGRRCVTIWALGSLFLVKKPCCGLCHSLWPVGCPCCTVPWCSVVCVGVGGGSGGSRRGEPKSVVWELAGEERHAIVSGCTHALVLLGSRLDQPTVSVTCQHHDAICMMTTLGALLALHGFHDDLYIYEA